MRRSLFLHPTSRCAAVESIGAEAARSSSRLTVQYFIDGEIGGLLLPLPSSPVRADELWRHTCFELFLRPNGQDRYYEFNFTPSLAWAAYEFDNYRSGMQPLEIPPPRMEMRQSARTLELRAILDLGWMAEEPADWQMGLSAVIEETNGGVSYWALAHPQGKPDFHHGGGFILTLPARAD